MENLTDQQMLLEEISCLKQKIKELEDANRWRDLKELPPRKKHAAWTKDCQVTDGQNVGIGYYSWKYETWRWIYKTNVSEWYYDDKITGWRPLPEPKKKGEL